MEQNSCLCRAWVLTDYICWYILLVLNNRVFSLPMCVSVHPFIYPWHIDSSLFSTYNQLNVKVNLSEMKSARDCNKQGNMLPFTFTLHCWHYFQFEEAYQAMLTAFQLFDFLNDGYISKIDFRRVLTEFGLSISPSELDYFLKKYIVFLIYFTLIWNQFILEVTYC